jgi:hypothetical protein
VIYEIRIGVPALRTLERRSDFTVKFVDIHYIWLSLPPLKWFFVSKSRGKILQAEIVYPVILRSSLAFASAMKPSSSSAYTELPL